MRFERDDGRCCKHWTCTEYDSSDTQSSPDGLIVLKGLGKGSSPSETQVDETRQSCYVDGAEVLHGHRFRDACRNLCLCSNGNGLCLPLCPPTEPEPVPNCIELHYETVPGLCCKKWKCKAYEVPVVVDMRELEANLSFNAPVVRRRYRSCFFNGAEIRHNQRFQDGCVGSCECKDGLVGCVSLCPPYREAPVPGCIDKDFVKVPGECCKKWKCVKYQVVDGNITVEELYHRTSEDEVDHSVQVHKAKRSISREEPHTGFATGDEGDASHIPAEKESLPPVRGIKQGCPLECKCPVSPTCPSGSPHVLDTCGCGCKVCAVGPHSTCDGLTPCDTSKHLTCDYALNPERDLGTCVVIREYRSCFNNGTEVTHGDAFYSGCAARCDCDDGNLKCEPVCKYYDPPLIRGCSKMRFEGDDEGCCKHWTCKKYYSKDTRSSTRALIVLKSLEKGSSPSETQVDETRQSCYVDGAEVLHGRRFQDGCRNLCLCSNGNGLCLPLCPPTEPEPVPDCIEMHYETVPGLCCKKWKCKAYEAQVVEDMRELEANLSLNAPVVRRSYRSCLFNGVEIRHNQKFQDGCVGSCECKDGFISCVSLCPPYVPAPIPGCIEMDSVAVPGECCKKWKCMKYEVVDGSITVEELYHRTSEDEVDHSVQVHKAKRRIIREEPHTVDDMSVGDVFSCNKEPTEWTPCNRPCGFGRSLRITYNPETCLPRVEKRLCMVRPCKGEYSSANYTILKSSKICNRLVRWQEPVRLSHRGCELVHPVSLRFCGECSDGRTCAPSSTETRSMEFWCPRKNLSITRQIMWVVNCQCERKGGKKKGENNISKNEMKGEGGVDVEEKGLKDDVFGV